MRHDAEWRLTIDVEWIADEERGVDLDEPAGEGDDLARAAAIFAELDVPCQLEVVEEALKDARIGARPRIDRLLLVADGEDVPVVAAELTDDGVLHRIEVLEFVDEDAIPARADTLDNLLIVKQLGSPEDEHVEVDDVPVVQKALVALEDVPVP